jgi:outer membrane protein OmpA-like peptidoglycan-associated protein
MKPLIIISWLTLGLFYWFLSTNCCVVGDKAVAVSEEEGKDIYAGNLAFAPGSSDPVTSDKTNTFLQSQLEKLDSNDVLRIIGQFDDNDPEGLGIRRAEEVRALLDEISNIDRIEVGEEEKDLEDDGWVEAYRFEVSEREPSIVEIDDRTLIYFPYNSVEQILDDEIKTYLTGVARRLERTDEKIYLIGHSDSFGNATYNFRLGMQRARVVEQYLISQGVSGDRIEVDSKGEIEPIAPNNTEEGRSRNRRTELIIK